MAVEQPQHSSSRHGSLSLDQSPLLPGVTSASISSLDPSIFTYQPKIGELSAKIAQSLQDDFLTRQQKHAEKQRLILEQALPPGLRQKIKLAPIAGHSKSRKSLAEPSQATLEEEEEEEQEESPKPDLTSTTEAKINQMISSSPYVRDPIKQQQQRRHQSKPDVQRKSINGNIETPRRERSASPTSLRPSRSRTMPTITNNRGALGGLGRETTSMTLDRLQKAHDLVQRAIAEKKIFCIAGTYYALRESLRERGWVEKFCFQPGAAGATSTDDKIKEKPTKKTTGRPRTTESSDSDDDGDPGCDADDDEEDKNRVPPWEEDNGFYGVMSRMLKNQLPNFIFTTKTSTIDYKMLQKDQIVNHYGKNSCLTTKNGLCVNLRNLPWYEPVDPNVFFPRCYKISTDEEKQDFIDDFRLSACQATIKWILEKFDCPIGPVNRRRRPSTSSDSPNTESPNENVAPSQLTPSPPSHPPPATNSARNASAKKPAGAEIPSKFVDIAVEQCEKYVVEREHGFLDVLREPHVLNDSQWDQFLQWYYQLVHGNGRLATVQHSLEKLQKLASKMDQLSPQFRMDGCRNIWIVKPGAKSRGRGVQCHAKLEEIIKLVSSQLIREGKYVVQKYIERPLLIYNTKFDIRQWFVVTDWNPLTMWFYEDCYLRFCSQLFSLEKFDESIHLSNNAIQANYQNAKDRSCRLPADNMWKSDTFKEYLRHDLGEPTVWDEIIYPGMKNAVIWALEACQDVITPRKNSFELFGADFMITEDFQPWLIEVNCSPCLAASTSITARMCPQVQEDVLKIVLDRRTDKNADVGRFEMAYKQPMVSAPNYLGLSLTVEGQNCGIKCPSWSPYYPAAAAAARHAQAAKDRRRMLYSACSTCSCRRVRNSLSNETSSHGQQQQRNAAAVGTNSFLRSTSLSDNISNDNSSDQQSDSESDDSSSADLRSKVGNNNRRGPTQKPQKSLHQPIRSRKSLPASLIGNSLQHTAQRGRDLGGKTVRVRTKVKAEANEPQVLSIATCRIDPSVFAKTQQPILEVEEARDDDEDGDVDYVPEAMCYQPDDDAELLERSASADPAANLLFKTGAEAKPLPFTSYTFTRPREEKPEVPATGHYHQSIAMRKSQVVAEQNAKTVTSMLTFHHPAMHHQRRPRTFMSYSSFIPSRVLKGPMFISNNMLENILNRARNTIAAAGSLVDEVTNESGAILTPRRQSISVEQEPASVSHQPLGIPIPKAVPLFGNSIEEAYANALDAEPDQQPKLYTFPKHNAKKAKKKLFQMEDSDLARRRSLSLNNNNHSNNATSMASPIRRVALAFQNYGSKRF